MTTLSTDVLRLFNKTLFKLTLKPFSFSPLQKMCCQEKDVGERGWKDLLLVLSLLKKRSRKLDVGYVEVGVGSWY